MERKQDALRGVESPLIFIAYERGPTRALLASTPHVAKLSTIVLPVHGSNAGVASTALAHRLAYPCLHPQRHEGNQTKKPDRNGTF